MNIVIVEDEAQVSKRIQRLTRELLGDRIGWLNAYSTIESASIALEREDIDLLLLDLNLSGRNGFDLLTELLGRRFQTIIISAYKDRAIEAYEHGVLDFVPKPIDETRLALAFNRFIGGDSSTESIPLPRRLAIKEVSCTEFIEVEQIERFSGASDYSEIHLISGKRKLCEKSLESLEVLFRDKFVRIHRSHLVRIGEIEKILSSEGSRYAVTLKNGEKLPLSRTRVGGLRKKLA